MDFQGLKGLMETRVLLETRVLMDHLDLLGQLDLQELLVDMDHKISHTLCLFSMLVLWMTSQKLRSLPILSQMV